MAAALREELAELTASVRAFLEWHAATGAEGLPGSLGALDAGDGAAWAPQLEAARPPPSASSSSSSPAAFSPPSHGFDASAASPARHQPAAPPARPSPAAPTRAPWAAEGAAAPRAEAAPRAGGGAQAEASRPDTPEERVARLALIAEEVRGCQKCPLHVERTQTVFSRGSPLSEIVFVGEGPGAEEDQQGEPFVGPAGQLLDRMIAAMGYRRDEVYICNIVKCRPPKNRKPEPSEMASCSPYLTAQLAVLKPRVIVALGASAVQGLIGTSEGITKLRGTWKVYKGTIPIMPTFHPAYLLRQPSAKRDVWSDLKEVMRFLGKSMPEKG